MTSTTSTTKTSRATLKNALALVKGSELVGFDIETTGLNPRASELRLAQVSDGVKTYVVDCRKVRALSL